MKEILARLCSHVIYDMRSSSDWTLWIFITMLILSEMNDNILSQVTGNRLIKTYGT